MIEAYVLAYAWMFYSVALVVPMIILVHAFSLLRSDRRRSAQLSQRLRSLPIRGR